jgi:hypothetical protein
VKQRRYRRGSQVLRRWFPGPCGGRRVAPPSPARSLRVGLAEPFGGYARLSAKVEERLLMILHECFDLVCCGPAEEAGRRSIHVEKELAGEEADRENRPGGASEAVDRSRRLKLTQSLLKRSKPISIRPRRNQDHQTWLVSLDLMNAEDPDRSDSGHNHRSASTDHVRAHGRTLSAIFSVQPSRCLRSSNARGH